MASALETLCGQAYGAKQYQKLGIYTYCAIISLIVVCFPVSLLWFFMDKLLTFIGQDPSISYEAGRYSIWLIPALFAYAILQSLVRYFQTQSLILPMLLSSCAVLCFHVPLCWALVYKMELGNIGAALAIGISYWLNVVLLGFYMKYSSSCEKTRVPFSKDVFNSVGEFFRLAIPSVVMVCLEWWSFELVILLSGLLPNPKLETSVLSICLTTAALHYFIPYGFSAAVSTRVSNELGAENPQAARVAVWAVMVLAVAEAIIISSALFCCRYVLGSAYSNVNEVVDYVKEMAPLICVTVIMDSLNAVLSGYFLTCAIFLETITLNKKILNHEINFIICGIRGCQRKWVATYGGLCQSWGILSGWNPSSCSIGFWPAFKRERSLDWNCNWVYSTVHFASSHYKFHRLAKPGNQGKEEDI
uniref:Putative MATE efflux family protein 8-like isoform X2 n=1 Tax=Davidia involucrata TaxID=16924 RepID=A0A5B6YMX5_DAVIN